MSLISEASNESLDLSEYCRQRGVSDASDSSLWESSQEIDMDNIQNFKPELPSQKLRPLKAASPPRTQPIGIPKAPRKFNDEIYYSFYDGPGGEQEPTLPSVKSESYWDVAPNSVAGGDDVMFDFEL